MLIEFKLAKVEYIRREHNVRVDLLSKLASTEKKSQHCLVIQQTITIPSIYQVECFSMPIDEI